jgi:hypothetical protein
VPVAAALNVIFTDLYRPPNVPVLHEQ